MISPRKAIAGLCISIISLAVAIIFLEIGNYFLYSYDLYSWDKRYMLFHEIGGGTVFENIGPIFKYQPNKKINSTTYYEINQKWVEEYSYEIPTNNFGLVQHNDIEINKPSLILLGDSFTEGQGVSPWFNRFLNNLHAHVQGVNGDLLGTGFAQWGLLLKYLQDKKINIKYVAVIFLSDDYRRQIWNFSSQTLKCIENYHACNGNENFYGMPSNMDLASFLEKLRDYRIKHLDSSENGSKAFLKRVLPASTAIYFYVKNGFKFPESPPVSPIVTSEKVIQDLIKRYQNNVLFIHIPQKDEVKFKRINPYGLLARKSIDTNRGKLVDGFVRCGLTNDDYYPNDGHPNQKGYLKIEQCVTNFVKDAWPGI